MFWFFFFFVNETVISESLLYFFFNIVHCNTFYLSGWTFPWYVIKYVVADDKLKHLYNICVIVRFVACDAFCDNRQCYRKRICFYRYTHVCLKYFCTFYFMILLIHLKNTHVLFIFYVVVKKHKLMQSL